MTDHITETLRQAMGSIVEIAPDPPDMPTEMVAQPRRGALRYAFTGFVVAAVLVAVGILLLTQDSSGPADENPLVAPDRPAELVLWQQEGSTELSPDEVADEVRGWLGVEFSTAWDGQRSYDEFLETFVDRPELVDLVDPLEFPDSVRVWVTDDFDRASLRSAARDWGFDVEFTSEDFIPLYVETDRIEPNLRPQVIPMQVDLPPEYDPPHVLVYGPEPRSSDFRRLWIEEWEGVDISRLVEDTPSASGWTPLDPPTGTAFLGEGDIGSIIIWQPDDSGAVIHTAGLAITADQLADITFSMQPADGGWEPTSLPTDMLPLFEGPNAPPTGTYVTLIAHPTEDSQSALLLMQQYPGGQISVEQSLGGLLSRVLAAEGAGFDIVEIRGHLAYVVEFPDGTSAYLWEEAPNHAVQLFIEGMSADSVIDSIVEFTADEWAALRQRHIGSGSSSSVTTIDPEYTR